ncbi:FAD-dependent monooxygenase [Paraglaciecola polaris]|uniref:3-hydroxybenzoate 6-hydroxylase 1 n=1 Tax=Paraglaciecola polaris LMG 21857 TaxID=1129793 RepID=K6ZGP0_9ALTE|nr:FAD-dependent monooxygenase [Paraglaciecola polaris]GAC35186.1 3-hydroxybenzoate 6-hydroxylase 1 [Paraglaciecola polaris LMG 21857]|tara:strand:- start:3640 stop:4833 length:1194 start_codon:yes stop_codon:yes gene_type:complete
MPNNIIIAGGGIGGLSAALALKRKGFTVHVLEKSDALGEVGAGIQLSPNAMHVLMQLGLSDAILSLGFLPQYATMRHYQDGSEYLRMPLGQEARQKYAAPYVHVHRADLHRVLYQAALERGVKISLNAQVEHYQHVAGSTGTEVLIRLHDGGQLRCDVLVGADGIRSSVKKCMLPQSALEFTGHVAWRGTLKSKDVPASLVKPEANLWIGPGAHLVSYYVRGGEEINVIAVQEREQWNDERWSVPGDISELRQAFSSWHPDVTQLLNKLDSCFLWGLFASQPLVSWVDGQVALLGDACHPMLPFVAQGAAMAIEDGFSLANALENAEDIHNGLLSYQLARSARVTKVQQMAANNADLYHMKGVSAKAKLTMLKATSRLFPRLASLPMAFIYHYNNTQ